MGGVYASALQVIDNGGRFCYQVSRWLVIDGRRVTDGFYPHRGILIQCIATQTEFSIMSPVIGWVEIEKQEITIVHSTLSPIDMIQSGTVGAIDHEHMSGHECGSFIQDRPSFL